MRRGGMARMEGKLAQPRPGRGRSSLSGGKDNRFFVFGRQKACFFLFLPKKGRKRKGCFLSMLRADFFPGRKRFIFEGKLRKGILFYKSSLERISTAEVFSH